MISSSSTSSRLATTIALLGPLLCLGAALVWLGREPTAPSFSKAAEEIQQRLGDRRLDVVVLGNSVAGRAIDPELLATLLPREKRVVRLAHVNTSLAPTWYAILSNLVYSRGRQPSLVLMVSRLENLLVASGHEDDSVIRDYLDADDDLVFEKTLGRKAQFLLRTELSARHKRRVLVDGSRHLLVGVLFGPRDLRWSHRGEYTLETATERVFDKKSLNPSFSRISRPEATPVRHKVHAVAPAMDSYLPHLIRLAHEHNSHIVFVRPPLSPTQTIKILTRDQEIEAIRTMSSLGAGWIDLTDLHYDVSLFSDETHMNTQGRARFTATLARELTSIGVFEGAPLPPSIPRPPTLVVREGKGPDPRIHTTENQANRSILLHLDLPEEVIHPEVTNPDYSSPLRILGIDQALVPWASLHRDTVRLLDSRGYDRKNVVFRAVLADEAPLSGISDSWWLYPGTSLCLSFSDGWAGSEAWIDLRTRVLGDAPDDSLLIEIEDRGIPLHQSEEHGAGRVELPPLGFEGPWRLCLHSSSTAPFRIVESLQARVGADSFDLLLRPDEGKTEALVFSGQKRTPVDVQVLGQRPSIRQGPVRNVRSLGWFLPLEGMEFLDSNSFMTATGSLLCSSLDLLHKGKPTTMRFVPCARVRSGEQETWCSTDGGILFQPPRGADPQDGRWSVAFKESRACASSYLLIPGDSLHGRPGRRSLERGADQLLIRGVLLPSSGPDLPIHVQLLVQGRTLLDRWVRAEEILEESRWNLDDPIPPGVVDYELVLTTSSEGGYLLLTNLALLDTGRR